VLETFAAAQMIDVHLPTTDGRQLLVTGYTELEPELKLLINTPPGSTERLPPSGAGGLLPRAPSRAVRTAAGRSLARTHGVSRRRCAMKAVKTFFRTTTRDADAGDIARKAAFERRPR
jgi:hypothetical protein